MTAQMSSALSALIPTVLVLVLLSFKLTVLHLPFYWDELVVYVRPAFWMADHGLGSVLPGHHFPGLFFGHTPGFSFGLAIVFKIFGESFLAGRSYSLALSGMQLYFLFRLGLELKGLWAGILSVCLYFFIPLVFAQSTMVVAEQGFTAFGLACLFYFLQNRPWAFLLVGIVGALMKETSAALLVPLAVIALAETIRKKQSRYLIYAIPLVVLLSFFVAERVFTGNISNFPFMNTLDLSVQGVALRACGYVLHYLVLSQWIGVLCVFSISGIWVLWQRGNRYRTFVILCALFLVCGVLGVSAFTLINQRYFLPIIPILALLSAVGLAELAGVVLSTLVLLLMGYLWIPAYGGANTLPGYAFDGNMEYVDVIHVQADAIAHLEQNFRERKISANWPIDAMLTEPRFGYVRSTVPVFDHGNNPEKAEVVVLAQNADRRLLGKADFLRERGFKLKVRFERKGKWVELWMKP